MQQQTLNNHTIPFNLGLGVTWVKIRIAPPRFELGSMAPKATMLDRYTTGLSDKRIGFWFINLFVLARIN